MRNAPPTFFLPSVPPEDHEKVYADLAQMVGRDVPPHRQRICSITFIHDGVEWTATVGRTMTGISHRTTRSRGKEVTKPTHHSDGATVMAIFMGNPYVVWTDGHQTRWENPFWAGRPTEASFFSDAG
jgi:hypothetical protein